MNLATIDEVAKEFKVSVSTIRAWMRQGLLPEGSYLKIAKTYRFNMDKLQEHYLNYTAPAKKPEAPAPVQLTLNFDDPDKDM